MWLSLPQIEEVELVTHTLLESSSWLDWWSCAAWSMILLNCNDEVKCYFLFVAGAWTRMMMAHISLLLWVNTVLKRWNEVLAKLKLNLIYVAWMELRNASIFNAFRLFPSYFISKAAKKSSHTFWGILKDSILWAVVNTVFQADKGSLSGFTVQAFGQQPVLQGILSREGPASSSFSQTPSKWGKGKKFWNILTSFFSAGGRHMRAALAHLAGPWGGDWMVEVLHSRYFVPFHHLPPVSVASRVPFLPLYQK